MILCDKDLKKLIAENLLGIEPLEEYQIGPTSIDLHLGNLIVKYDIHLLPSIELGKTSPQGLEVEMNPESGYTLDPKEFVLGCTLERIRIPNGYQGFIETPHA